MARDIKVDSITLDDIGQGRYRINVQIGKTGFDWTFSSLEELKSYVLLKENETDLQCANIVISDLISDTTDIKFLAQTTHATAQFLRNKKFRLDSDKSSTSGKRIKIVNDRNS